MRRLLALSLLLTLGCAGSVLRIASVERSGLPPYEDQARLYRILGDGVGNLHAGDSLDLRRLNERRELGRLEVVSSGPGFVLARLASPGDTYPLVGDLAVSRDIRPQELPEWPEAELDSLPDLANFAPLKPQGEPRLEERFFFLRGSTELSPAGISRLESWVQAYGPGGHWYLRVPEDPRQPEDLVQVRRSALKTRLEGLGVKGLEIRKAPFESHQKYDLIFVGREP